MTREHGMTFREDMVAAIRSGRKTQTRRLMDPQPIFTSDGGAWYPPLDVERGKNLHYGNEDHFRRGVVIDFCPWQVGDRIFIKEPFWERKDAPPEMKCPVRFTSPCEENAHIYRRRPANHLLPWAARTWLEITEIRVQRIQEISEGDSIAEGVREGWNFEPGTFYNNFDKGEIVSFSAASAFRDLWKSLYPGSWERNEYVWVLDFKLIEGKGG